MSSPAVTVANISKQYRIGALERSDRTLREALSDLVAAPIRRLKNPTAAIETIWALKDVSFEVQPGEVVGLIGRNGAGKSTLLKVLSRITEPTTGRVALRGRVASLLEVGTGFHPELTGRENIYLNGAILGMTRREIERKFDEIVAFAEVEKFIDTPVKRYSSGMYLRLAFAVSAHLEPEILVVDEVLAVGDSAFQKKCLGKMQNVSQQGRTVLFVSHNMGAVKALCNRGVVLCAGEVAYDGPVDGAVDAYFAAGASAPDGVIPDDLPRIYSTDEARVRQVQIVTRGQDATTQLFFGQPFRVAITFDVLKPVAEAVIEVGVVAMDGAHVTHSSSIDGGHPGLPLQPGRYRSVLELDPFLLPRHYYLMVAIHHYSGTTIDYIERALDFAVANVAENGRDHYRWPRVRGYVRPPGRWEAPVLVASTAADTEALSVVS